MRGSTFSFSPEMGVPRRTTVSTMPAEVVPSSFCSIFESSCKAENITLAPIEKPIKDTGRVPAARDMSTSASSFPASSALLSATVQVGSIKFAAETAANGQDRAIMREYATVYFKYSFTATSAIPDTAKFLSCPPSSRNMEGSQTSVTGSEPGNESSHRQFHEDCSAKECSEPGRFRCVFGKANESILSAT